MSKISKQDIWIILAGYLAAINVGKLAPIIPILQNELDISFAQAGLSLSLIQGAGMLFALCIGAFSERIGLKLCLIVGLIILGISSIAGYFINTVFSLYLFRFGEGIGYLCITICAPAILKRISTSQSLNFKLGLWSSYMGGGVGFAILTIPLLLDYMTWQELWVILGCVSFFIAAMIQWCVTLKEEISISQQNSSFLNILKITLTHPPVLCLAIIFSCYAGQWTTLVGLLPSMYVNDGLSLKTAGMLVSVVVLANLVGTFSGGSLLQRGISPSRLLNFSLISVLVANIIAFSTTKWLSFEFKYISAILSSLLGGLIPTTIFAITIQYAPRLNAIAASVGLVIQVSACAQLLIVPLSAFVVTKTQDWSSLAIISSCLCLLGLMMVYFLFQNYSSKYNKMNTSL
ncbi:CynX/NimT family MFS transporter [Acinetobacter equi]|uniref:MFS transporter n=1 Tax=Acinetobacter equi TaxID=1324350 RepID=A0A0N9VFC4_9GAMM|nr:MFS transporter [Acinetobacter equi]ALH96215.1 MFS transporter [Acinetobacter equi]